MAGKRLYEETHPWIDYQIDLTKAPARMWEALGEAVGHCRDLAKVPLQPDVSERLHQVYLAKGVAATTAIEGNTLDESQVAELVRDPSKNLIGPPEYQQQEVRNIVTTFNYVYDAWPADGRVLATNLIMDFHQDVLIGVDNVAEGTIAGEFRTHSVGVPGYNYLGAPAEDCPYLVDRLCDWLNGTAFQTTDPNMQGAYCFIRAIVAHIYLAWIHPFGDGNGRVARLVEFHSLIGQGVPKIALHLFSQHYQMTRNQYYNELDYTHRSGGYLFQFIEYAVRGFVECLQEQLRVIRAEVWKVTWENYVHSTFDGKSETAQRQKHLLLHLYERPAVSEMMIPGLSPELEKAYRDKTFKTVTRDVNKLLSMGLLKNAATGLVVNTDTLFPFESGQDIQEQVARDALERIAS